MPISSAVADAPLTQFQHTALHGHAPKKQRKFKEPSKFARHQFNCYDGEGYDIDGVHQYVYLCCWDGTTYRDIRNDKGLSSEQCFHFLTSCVTKWRINVIYGGSYDANMMLRDLPFNNLKELHELGRTEWRDWRIRFIHRKEFTVTYLPTGKTCKLWDVIGFFQCSFIQAIESWLDVHDTQIQRGKKARSAFRANQLEWIISYCQRELYLFEQLMQRLWESVNRAGLVLNRWDGAGAIAQCLLEQRQVYQYKGTEEQQAEHYDKARCAYAGGRFELIAPGDYRQPVWNYDINSAYPRAMLELLPFSGLTECDGSCDLAPTDLVRVEYYGDIDSRVHPLFHRHSDHSVSYPLWTIGWHWGVEVMAALRHCNGIRLLDRFHWCGADRHRHRPFGFLAEYYDLRRELQIEGDCAEKAFKLGINSTYGKVVQQRGWREGRKLPRFHQLYWGGWITAHTRSAIYEAMMQAPDSIIAVETDGIFTTVPLDLDIGSGLGQWGCKEYQSLTYVQSGLYFGTLADGTVIERYRGLDKGALHRDDIIKGWAAYERGGPGTIKANATRFRTLGTSLVGARFDQWRQWKKEKKEVALVAGGKRLHSPACPEPWGYGTHHDTIAVQPQVIESAPYNVLWADTESKRALHAEIDEEWEVELLGN